MAAGDERRQADRSRREALKGLVKAELVDEGGRHWAVMVPFEDDDPEKGIVIGPPDVSELGLPESVSVKLHNELYRRGLITKDNLRGRAGEVFAALQAAYKADTTAVLNLYR